jgi:hypothetical protein
MSGSLGQIFLASNHSDQHKDKGPHNHSDGHMGEGWMNGMVIAEIGKRLIYILKHVVTPWCRKGTNFAGRS